MPMADEFPVNRYTAGGQVYPSVAALADGGFVAAWASYGQDGSHYGVYAQRFGEDGAAEGAELPVNTYTPGLQSRPAVAGLAGGGFVVTWVSAAQDGSSYGDYGQRFDDSGARVGGELRLNATTAGAQYAPSVAALGGGGFVAVWTSEGQDGSGDGVYGQRFGPDGGAAGGEFRINDTTRYDQSVAGVAGLGDGGFVAVWTSDGQDGSGDGVYARRYGANGVPVTGELRVNTTTAGDQQAWDVDALADGGWLVAWDSLARPDSDPLVRGQRYGADGGALGSELPLATDVNLPTAAGLADGGFVLVWHVIRSSGDFEFSEAVFGQRFRPDGAQLGGRFQLTPYSDYFQQEAPSIAGLGDGGFAVLYTGYGRDGSGYGVFGQRFGPALLGKGADDLLEAGPYRDLVLGQGGDDTLTGRGGSDSLGGGLGEDQLSGGAGDDSLAGGGDDDRLLGGAGSDTLAGGGGADTLNGGPGADWLTGGAGKDRFDFRSPPSTAGIDVIGDFAGGVDRVGLDISVFTQLHGPGPLPAWRLYQGPGATGGHDGGDRVVFDTTGGTLWYDPDGSGPLAATPLVELPGVASLTAGDFLVLA
jgi:Ca2+-binding RTX toxin-like protein